MVDQNPPYSCVDDEDFVMVSAEDIPPLENNTEVPPTSDPHGMAGADTTDGVVELVMLIYGLFHVCMYVCTCVDVMYVCVSMYMKPLKREYDECTTLWGQVSLI